MFHFNSTEDGEKNDQDKAKELLIEPPSQEEKKLPKRRCGQKKEQPEAIMASFFAGLDIYQTKILVSHFSIISLAVYNKNLFQIKMVSPLQSCNNSFDSIYRKKTDRFSSNQ